MTRGAIHLKTNGSVVARLRLQKSLARKYFQTGS